MKLRSLFAAAGLCAASSTPALAGGLFLPGSGAVSTTRAGAAIASTDDGEALAVNPAGLAKAGSGTVLTIGATAIDYIMSFTRTGTYDTVDNMGMGVSYAGQKYPTMTNESHPPLGIGAYQPVPVVAIVSDLGGAVHGLHVAFGLYAPNAYPFRKLTNVNGQEWQFDTAHFDSPPPPTRYDIVEQEAAVILPTIAVGYRITDKLDIGARFSSGVANLKSTIAVWGVPLNYQEFVKEDALITLNAKDSFVPAFGGGVTYRPTREIELAANYTSEVDIHAQGTAQNINGPAVTLGTSTPVIIPTPNGPNVRCAPNGTAAALSACVDLALPQTAQIGGRYKFLDDAGGLKGDIELDLDWENWGATSDYHVVVDGEVVTTQNPDPAGGLFLKDTFVRHGFQDTYAARLGGSYVIPVGEGHRNAITVRGGISYDTAAATPGWERVDLDGAARTTIAGGGSYRFGKVRLDAGVGVVLEGTRTNPGNCNPTQQALGCQGNNMDAPIDQRHGPDPTTPIVDTESQAQSPVNQGTITSHYLMFMLGVTTWF